jgi:hypothetical protein
MPRDHIKLHEQADGRSRRAGQYHQLLKRRVNRTERHRAKRDPECRPCYGRYQGYER